MSLPVPKPNCLNGGYLVAVGVKADIARTSRMCGLIQCVFYRVHSRIVSVICAES